MLKNENLKIFIRGSVQMFSFPIVLDVIYL